MSKRPNPSELLILGLNPKTGKRVPIREKAQNPRAVTYDQAAAKQEKAIEFMDRMGIDDQNDLAGMTVDEYAAHKGLAIKPSTNPERKRKQAQPGPQRRAGKKAGKQKRGNPGTLAQGEKLYQSFHGKSPAEVQDMAIKTEVQRDYVALGDLSQARFIQEDGREWSVNFSRDGVKLAASPDGKQLYLIGGDQDILPILKDQGFDTSKDLIAFGRWFCVYYIAAKSQTNFEITEWEHYLGCVDEINALMKESKAAKWTEAQFQAAVVRVMKATPPLERDIPQAIFDKLNKRILFAGGSYYVDWPGIVG